MYFKRFIHILSIIGIMMPDIMVAQNLRTDNLPVITKFISDTSLCIMQVKDSGSFGNEDVQLEIVNLKGKFLHSMEIGAQFQEKPIDAFINSSGNIVVSGNTNTYGNGSHSLFIIESDMNGNTVDSLTITSPGYDDLEAVIHTTDGGMLLAGTSNYFSGAVTVDVFLLKLDANYNVEWANAYQNSGFGSVSSICQFNSGYAITGTTTGFGSGDKDSFVLNVDSIGDPIWTRTINMNGDQKPKKISALSNGLVIMGHEEQTTGMYDLFVVKFTNSGSLSWNRLYDHGLEDSGYDMQVSGDTIFIAGYRQTYTGTWEDMMRVRITGLGQLISVAHWPESGGQYGSALLIKNSYNYLCKATLTTGVWDYEIYGIKGSFYDSCSVMPELPEVFILSLSVIDSSFTVINADTIFTYDTGCSVISVPSFLTVPTCNIVLPGTIGTQEYSTELKAEVYPNPSSEKLFVSFAGSETCSLDLIDVSGRIFYSSPMENNASKTIDVSEFSPGIYFLRINYAERFPELLPIIIE